MRRLATTASLFIITGICRAQNGTIDPGCAAATPAEARDACQKAVDIYRYFAPQLGTTVAGSNGLLAAGGALGGIGRWTIGAGGTVIGASIPKIISTNAPGTGAVTASSFATDDTPAVIPSIDVAVGLFGGIPVGLTKIGAIDVLGNATTLRSLVPVGFTVTSDQRIKIGYGARVGLLQDAGFIPGVTVSYVQRAMPTSTLTAFTTEQSTSTDTLEARNMDVLTRSTRVTVSKSISLFGIAVGASMDEYESSSDIAVVIHRPALPLVSQRFATASPVHVESLMKRTNYFANLSAMIGVARVVAEAGMAKGGELLTFNTFPDTPPMSSRAYASIGVRLGF
jgi:hypothetical protein